MNAEFRDLCESYVNETLTGQQIIDLEKQLATGEEARLSFLAYLEVHAGLAWEFRGPVNKAEVEPIIPFPRKKPFSYLLPVAAAIAIMFTIVALYLGGKPADEPVIAVVKASLHGQWANGEEVISGKALKAGVWNLQSGVVELHTGPGTVLLLEGPATLELNDPLHARLVAGNLVVRMPKGKSGFVVDLPRMKVTDLGTEFGVSVTADGESRVQVYDGKVRAESNRSNARELEAGETMSCAIDGKMVSATFSEDRFIRTFPPTAPETQAGGPLYSKSKLDSVNVAAVTEPVVVDADLREWNRSVAFQTACEPPFTDTYFVEGMMMYDSENLYLAAHVGDPEPMRSEARTGMEFVGGSVIVRVSTDRSLGWPLKGNVVDARSKLSPVDNLNPKITTMIMWYDHKSDRPQIAFSHGFDSHSKPVESSGWTGAFRKDADSRGYTLEYKIPWALLNCAGDPPQAGDQLAGLWMAHWSDREGRICRGQLVDVTNPLAPNPEKIAPYLFFQNGPFWGKINYLSSDR